MMDSSHSYEIAARNNPGWKLLLSTAAYCTILALLVFYFVRVQKPTRLYRFGKEVRSKMKEWFLKLRHGGTPDADGNFAKKKKGKSKKDEKESTTLAGKGSTPYVSFDDDAQQNDMAPDRVDEDENEGNGGDYFSLQGIFEDNEADAYVRRRKMNEKYHLYVSTTTNALLEEKEYEDVVKDVSDDQTVTKFPDAKYPGIFHFFKSGGDMASIHKLAAPWMFSSLVSHCSGIVIVYLISHHIGEDDMVAYVTVEFYLYMFHMVAYGIYDSFYKNVNVAVAAEDEFLAGQYVQISTIFSLVASIPAVVFATLWMEDFLHWLGFCDYIAAKGHDYAILSSALAVMDNMNGIWWSLLDLTGYANFSAGVDFIESASSLMLATVGVIHYDFSLFQLGLFWIIHGACWILISAAVVAMTGWLRPYYRGMKNFGLANSSAVNIVLRTSVPLILVAISLDIEWRILSLFIDKTLGPAEAAAWILLDYVWSLLETWTNNFASAAQQVVTNHLSMGDAKVAKKTVNQSLVLGVVYGCLESLILCFIGDWLISVLTADATLALIMRELLPYLAIGNPFVSIGTVASGLNEAQGKYYIGLWLYWMASIFVTIPVAAILLFGFGFNAEGIAAAVAMGYTTSSMAQVNILLESNFDKAVERTKALVEEEDGGDDKSCEMQVV